MAKGATERDNREQIASPEQRRLTRRLARLLKGGKDYNISE